VFYRATRCVARFFASWIDGRTFRKYLGLNIVENCKSKNVPLRGSKGIPRLRKFPGQHPYESRNFLQRYLSLEIMSLCCKRRFKLKFEAIRTSIFEQFIGNASSGSSPIDRSQSTVE